MLRLRESLALADARRATAERELRDAREDAAAAAAPPRSPLAARNAPEPAAGRERGHRAAPRAVQEAARRDERETGPGPPGRVRRESFVAKGDLEQRRAAIDLRLRFRPADARSAAGEHCHFHRQWHL